MNMGSAGSTKRSQGHTHPWDSSFLEGKKLVWEMTGVAGGAGKSQDSLPKSPVTSPRAAISSGVRACGRRRALHFMSLRQAPTEGSPGPSPCGSCQPQNSQSQSRCFLTVWLLAEGVTSQRLSSVRQGPGYLLRLWRQHCKRLSVWKGPRGDVCWG